ncbi:MAG TPA: coproporphyrinogen-III oxidase family protein [Bryobacteraceae bacterium]|nr:coproporphyrinogen-III oxidase family protein [Bryobacteraceae bacterium]
MAGVYISYPFCGQKCSFCNFASGPFPRTLAVAYFSALRAEIASHRWSWRPETLYLGGGSPGDLDAAAVLGELIALLPGGPWVEATIEAAPGSITPDRASAWLRLGINRVSLGVQSFVSAELARTGRRHDASTVAAEVAVLRQAGIGNFSIDLIAGLPGQTPESWRESLDWIERLDAPHVSVYMLEIDEDSRLGKEILSGGKRYGAPEVPSEDAMAELYEVAVDRLGAMGLPRYEISNFARPGRESRHNLKYWRLEPYAGFGADAHSFDGATRSQNVESPVEYVARFKNGVSAQETATPARLDQERFYVGLRLMDGLRPTAEEWRRFGGRIQRLAGAGLLQSDGERLRLTGRGVLLSNEVFREFIDA